MDSYFVTLFSNTIAISPPTLPNVRKRRVHARLWVMVSVHLNTIFGEHEKSGVGSCTAGVIAYGGKQLPSRQTQRYAINHETILRRQGRNIFAILKLKCVQQTPNAIFKGDTPVSSPLYLVAIFTSKIRAHNLTLAMPKQSRIKGSSPKQESCSSSTPLLQLPWRLLRSWRRRR